MSEKITAEVGSMIDFSQVLMLTKGDDVRLGTPYINGCAVKAEILGHGRGKKIKIINFFTHG